MNVERISLRNTGLFTEPVQVGPFADGLNILAAGNEAGKSTLLLAAARALFDRHTVSGEAVDGLQPAGTKLAPDVTVDFRTGQGRFRIRKRFLLAPESELSREHDGVWSRVADGDAADRQVLELIGGVRAGRGASKAEHWGLLRYLWARQGEAVDWPAWDDEAGTRIRTGLARVELDPLVESLRTQFHSQQADQFTATGRVARNSPLSLAQQEVETLEAQYAAVRAEMERGEENRARLTHLQDQSAAREQEMLDAAARAKSLTAALNEVELLRKDLEQFESAYQRAQERMTDIHKDKKTLHDTEARRQETVTRQEEQRREEQRLRREEDACRTALEKLQLEAKAARGRLDQARRHETRWRDIQSLRAQEDHLSALRHRQEAMRDEHTRLEELLRRQAAFPAVNEADLARLEKARQGLRELAVRAETVGLRITMTPRQDGTVLVQHDDEEAPCPLQAGTETTVTASRRVRLALPDWGEIAIASGAEEAAALEAQRAAQQTALEARLNALGVASMEQARTVLEQTRQVAREIAARQSRFAELLEAGETAASLSKEIDRLAVETGQRRHRLDPSEEEMSATKAELAAELTRLRTAIEADEEEGTLLETAIAAHHDRVTALGSARETATKRAQETDGQRAALDVQSATIRARYAVGIDRAEEEAQVAFVSAKAQYDTARRNLPEDWEKLAARHERALKSAAQAEEEYRRLERDIIRMNTLVEHAGTLGLYGRETRLVEALEGVRQKTARLENQALAARFLAALIDDRKKAAVVTVLRPLEDQLSATFAEIPGVHHRRVFLDENLQVAGIGRARDACIPFHQLSQGAREQLLLALRAAAALELARNGPQILILDDVLVNTDAVRQQNVLDFIQHIARQVQVLILTCHADRYRGLAGHNLELRRTDPEPPAGS